MESKLVIAGVSTTVLFGWEHIARLFGIVIKPSLFLSSAASLFNYVFENFGKTLGIASGYLWWLKLDEVKKTCKDLFTPVLDIVSSPRLIQTGWYNYVKTFLGNNFNTDSWQFYLGLFGIMAMVTILIGTHMYKKGKNYCPVKRIRKYLTGNRY